jgi:hypothetical protein
MPKYIEISAEEAMKIVTSKCHPFESYIDFERDEYMKLDENGDIAVRYYEDDVIFNEDFAVGRDPVLVSGDLIVNGLLSDCDDADASLLVVCGNVKAANIFSLSEMIIGKNLDISELGYFNSLCDYHLLVGGTLTARAIVNDGTFSIINGGVNVPKIITPRDDWIVQGESKKALESNIIKSPSDVLHSNFVDDSDPEYPSAKRDKIGVALHSKVSVLKTSA